ncbi:MAG TPA: hypothetical protein VMR34_05535 [Candidatus Saccharimonadales bacterium]|nr:hypothetical protein [Candidatus Saccharimonadales bacterium]
MDISRFQKVYANLPIAARNEIVVVLDEVGPLTWNAAYVEIINETALGKTIMKKLIEMGLI